MKIEPSSEAQWVSMTQNLISSISYGPEQQMTWYRFSEEFDWNVESKALIVSFTGLQIKL